MPILRKHYTKDYTVVPNTIVRDIALSYKARGIFLYLWHLPDAWDISLKDIENHSQLDGATSVRSGIRELETRGYLAIQWVRDAGQFSDAEWIITAEPSSENPNPVNSNSADATPLKYYKNPSTKKEASTHKCLTDGISVRSGPKRTKSPLRTHRRSDTWHEERVEYLDMPDDPNAPLVRHCLDSYFSAYCAWKGRPHPQLKDRQLRTRQTILSEAFDRLGIDCEASVDALVATYWARSFVKQDGTKATDRNLNAFATEAVLDHLAQTMERAGVR